MGTRITTLGHSNRSLDELVALLRAHGVTQLLDIRRVPASRRHPQFNAAALAIDLPAAGIGYRSVPELGGRRSRRKGSPHVALTDPAIAGYADYMDTDAFRTAARDLLAAAAAAPTGIMCAEAKPESCHRRLLCDWLAANDAEIVHAIDASTARPHELTAGARLHGKQVVYDLGQLPLLG